MGLKVTRLDGESIALTGTLEEGEEILVQVSNTRKGRSSLYIEAPQSIRIDRR